MASPLTTQSRHLIETGIADQILRRSDPRCAKTRYLTEAIPDAVRQIVSSFVSRLDSQHLPDSLIAISIVPIGPRYRWESVGVDRFCVSREPL